MTGALCWRTKSIFAAGFAGVFCLNGVAAHYRIDTVAERCSLWPPLAANLCLALFYVCGIALATWTWLQTVRYQLSMKQVWLLGVAMHLGALMMPPYLSIDSLYYAAIGKVLAHGGSVYVALNQTLAPNDPLLELLPVAWQYGTSPYPALFNQFTHLVALVPGTIRHQLLIYQLFGACLVALTAWLAGRATKNSAGATFTPAQTVALVLLCPLGIVEATQNAHNDAFLMPLVAVGAFLLLKKQRCRAAFSVALGLALKASAAIPVLLFAGASAADRLRRRWIASALLLAALAVACLWALHVRWETVIGHSLALLGSPQDPIEHCTRSWECIPRAVLHYAYHRADVAWLIGLAFRVAGAVWIIGISWRAARAKSPLALIGNGIFIYYLFFHGYMQSWYLLVALPLLPWVSVDSLRAQKLFLTTLVLYYPISLIFQCGSEAGFVAREVVGGFLTVGLTACYWLSLRRKNIAAQQENTV